MGLKISETSRTEVMQKWFQGHSRNKVAAICGISPGAVSGIINDWKRSFGVGPIEQLRDLATTIARNGISITQCAQGYRIAIMLRNLGVNEDEEESFLGETYSRFVGIGISPQDIASHLKDLVSFIVDGTNLGIGMDTEEEESERRGEGDVSQRVPSILQIAKYLQKTKDKIQKLELKKDQKKDETELFEAKKAAAKQETEEMLKKHDMTAEKLDWYLNMKTELLASGHAENDFEALGQATDFLKGYGHNYLAISSQFSDHERLRSSVRRLQVQESVVQRNVEKLEERARISEQVIESKSQMQWHMIELEKMGFNFKALKHLYNGINEIHEANGFSQADGYAVRIFLDQFERHYDTLLGFEKRIDESRAEMHNLDMQRLIKLNTQAALPYVGSALARLLNGGVREDQIVKLANQLEMHPGMIQSFLETRSSDADEGEQGQEDHSAPIALSSSKSSSSLSHSQSPFPPQQRSPHTSTEPTLQNSSSPSLTEPHSTSSSPTSATTHSPIKSSADSVTSDTGSPIKSSSPSLSEHSPMEVRHRSPGVAEAASMRGSSPLGDKSSQHVDQEETKPTPTYTATVFGREITIPKAWVQILLDASKENNSQTVHHRKYEGTSGR